MKVLLNYSNLNAFIDRFELLSNTQQEKIFEMRWIHTFHLHVILQNYISTMITRIDRQKLRTTELKRNVLT